MTPYQKNKGLVAFPWDNLVGEGCGAKLGVIIGAMRHLEETGLLSGMTRFAGTSASSIIMSAYAAGYSVDEIRGIFYEKDMTELLDDTFGPVRDIIRLLRDGGWYKGEALLEWMGELFELATGNKDITFEELHRFNREQMERELQLFIFGTNLETRQTERYSHIDTPDMPVRLAVRISTAIPFFFVPALNMEGQKCVDGGTARNYAIDEFDHLEYMPKSMRSQYLKLLNEGIPSPVFYNMRTLGIRADEAATIAYLRDGAEPSVEKVEGVVKVGIATADSTLEGAVALNLQKRDRHRTIFCDTGDVKSTQFDLTLEQKKSQVRAGQEAAEEYLKFYWNGDKHSLNRPDQFDLEEAWENAA